MDWLVQSAHAAGGAGGESSPLMGIVLPVILLVVFYFLLIRPQQKRAKEHRQMVQDLQEGDEIVTTGGLVGQLNEVDESFARVQIADNVEVRIQKTAVSSLLPKGTLDN